MTRRTIGWVAAAVFGVGLCGVCVWQLLGEHYGVGVDSVRWLPPEAHNITYMKNDALTTAEFDIGREAYERWCADRGMRLSEIRNEKLPVVTRPVGFLVERGVIRMTPEPNEEDRFRLGTKRLSAGDLFFEIRWPDGGGYTLGYDVREGRGYYFYVDH